MSSQIEEVKSRLDIIEVIGGYIKLKKCGANYRACCPFHSEKKPSFFVSPARQIWHCFGCGKGGSVFDFVKEIEGVEFGDALRLLAQKTGVDLKPIKPELKTKRQRLYEICELSCKFFEKQLNNSKVGNLAKDYLLNRGINKDSIEKWRLGYAPDKKSALSDFLLSMGYNINEAVEAGLSVKNNRGYLDRFQSRIIFPVFDLNSQVIGFGGRIFGLKAEKEIAKYVNSPGTFLYDKSKTLYGLDRARVEIRKKNFVILVEGYTDCILAHQAGSENTVATSGTALTPLQLKILKRYSSNIVTAFDMDVAGNTATQRGIDLAQSMDFNIKVITMPQEKDPADIILEDPDNWKELLKSAKSILDFYFELAFSNFDKSKPEDKKEISKFLLPAIKRISNKIVQSHWVQKLAEELRVRVEDVEKELNKVRDSEKVSFEEKGAGSNPSKPRKEKIEELFLSLSLREPKVIGLLEDSDLSLFSQGVSNMLGNIIGFVKDKKGSFDLSEFQKSLSGEDLNFINPLILKAEIDEECSEIDPIKEARFCLKEIRNHGIKNKLEDISYQIRMAEKDKDSNKVSKLVEEFADLSKKINN